MNKNVFYKIKDLFLSKGYKEYDTRNTIYDLLNKSWFIFLIGAVLGALFFIYIYGIDIIKFTNNEWILEKRSDLVQHYLGWEFYRRSEPGFPFGLVEGVLYPEKVSMIYMDVIPLFALIFRIISFIFSLEKYEFFQYLGLFGIITFMLQGGISAIMIKKLTSNFILSIIASIWFIIFPNILDRMYIHTALAFHTMILLPIYLLMFREDFSKTSKAAIAWSIVMGLASVIHIYFILMVGVFLFGFVLRDFIDNKNYKKSLIIMFSSILTGLIVLYIFGAFYTKTSLATGGLGDYSANLNTFFNSMGRSYFFRGLTVRGGQYEGKGYLGFGVIILSLISIIIYVFKNTIKPMVESKKNLHKKLKKKRKIKKDTATRNVYLLICFIFIFIAISPIVTFYDKVLFTIPYPQILTKILSMFRSTGRFIWPAMYLIMFWSIYTVYTAFKGFKKNMAIVVIIACVFIQCIDLSVMMKSNKGKVTFESELKSEAWYNMPDGITQIVYMSYKYSYDFSVYALENGFTLNDFNVARKSMELINKYKGEQLNKILNDDAPENILYIFQELPEDIYNQGLLNFYEIDGFIVGLKNEIIDYQNYENCVKL